MKRNYPINAISRIPDLIKHNVSHEASHTAAIYLYTEQKQLPPAYFQITVKKIDDSPANPIESRAVSHDHFAGMAEGECLIHSLPVTLIESANYFSLDEQDAFSNCF